ncbi:hypothetical protein P4H27_10100 [Paenibacillus taichungensis]|uniref:hypothetical protein n=1 Tax=Paenibacillus taichungensis TaxID=484184 RepID=UPI002DBB8FED|nr:hypothetical protein [Paenibacillus taichungensis]MEC0107288.1 hypothetical protein [Paenibacillus taichungensis]MEC0194780.1 hypothetical protein [Paenibacillus taichungensis]
MESYIIESTVATDKKYVKQYLKNADQEFKFPCKVSVITESGTQHYLVDRGNISGHEYLVIDWSKTHGY